MAAGPSESCLGSRIRFGSAGRPLTRLFPQLGSNFVRTVGADFARVTRRWFG